jgi:uncharacterized membrane protein
MDWSNIHAIIAIIQRIVSLIGVLIIITGVFYCLCQYVYFVLSRQLTAAGPHINTIRLNLGRVLILGLEFIVAADLIGTTTTPDYYAVGLLAIIVVVRTILSFSINRELMSISKEPE